MKHQVFSKVSKEQVIERLPPKLRKSPGVTKLQDTNYCLIVIISQKVVLSTQILKLVEKHVSDREFVCAGYEFTLEAKEAIEEKGGIVINERYFGWTDASVNR